MNIKTKKVLQRFAAVFLFWCMIIIAGILLLENTSSSGFGSGSGQGGSGNGSGKGASTHGTGSGKGEGKKGEGTGKSEKSTAKKGSSGETASVKKQEKQSGKKEIKGVAKMTKTPPVNEAEKEGGIRVVDQKDMDEDAALIHLPKKVAVSKTAAAGTGTGKGFFGVEVGGDDRAVFLLDISGSMQNTTNDGNLSRLDLVKSEMEKSLKTGYRDAVKRGKNGIFFIASFSNDCSFYPQNKRRCHFRNVSDVSAATVFVRKLSPSGSTNMMHAWGMLLPIIRERQIRTVYFLSDGEPSDCNAQQLMDFLSQRFPTLKIHTFSMGQNSQLLKNIAKQHNGIYREIY